MNYKIIFLAVIMILFTAQAVSAYHVPQEYRMHRYMKDPEVWIVSEKNIEKAWAQDNLQQLAQNYVDHGISKSTDTKWFVNQKGMKELRVKMTYYANMLKLDIPPMMI